VLGVDPSAQMVRIAEERRASELPEVADRVRFLVADPRSLRLSERFPLVLAPQHALGLAGTPEGLEALLAAVRHHLTPGGTFIYDILNPPREPPSDRDEEAPGAPVEPRRPLFALHLRGRRQAGGASAIRRLRLRHFTPEELDAALQACGLTLRERYGRFDGKPFDPDDNWHIGVAQG
jgi:SAM-dependent methyltransferase